MCDSDALDRADEGTRTGRLPGVRDAPSGWPAWHHGYNHHRPHTAIGGKPPVSRLTNVPGQHT